MGEELGEKLLVNRKEEGEEKLGRKIWVESKKLWIVAGPAIFTRFSMFGVAVISQAFIGHIGSTELGGFALVTTVIFRFCTGIQLGMASALETLCGQAYGAKQYHMLGIYLQRSWIVLFSVTIILLPLFIFTAPILRLLGQADDISAMAGTIALMLIPIIFTFIFSFTLQMYLQAQSKNIIIAYLAVIQLAIHIFLSWLMVVKLRWGVVGIMVSIFLSDCIPIVGMVGYICFGGCPDTWQGLSIEALKNLWPIIKLSLSSGAMLCLELWYNTILVLLTGHMKNAEIAIDALSICLNINGWEMMIAIGFLAAASVRVSNELGRANAKGAKFSVVVTVATSLIIGLALFIVFMLFRGKISYMFTNNPEVSAAVGDLSPLLSLSILLNSIQPVLSGVAVGAGWQSVVAYVNLACYYLIGIPLGVVLGYAIGFQVKGIWIGMLLGTVAQTLVLSYLTWRTDWDDQVAKAATRLNKWSVPSTEETNSSLSTA
ncbi:protein DETOXIFICATION 21-like [Magnolia sinica]|uniref:protein DETOXIFICATION 21-like n=1 Tax=Magnolia sinica TaxID=86752 RepID=UPI002659D386|nr:protein DETOXIFICATION 21-like [Magnolia sinica]